MPLDAKHYILVGASRLTSRIAGALAGPAASVTIIRTVGDAGAALGSYAGVTVHDSRLETEEETLKSIGPAAAACLLAVSDDDLTNLRWAMLARKVAPDLPVVLRVFDQSLGDQLELGLNIRRAFSVSSLAAPSFIAAACHAQVLETIRIGDAETPICRLKITSGSVLENMSAASVKALHGCATIALTGDDGVLHGLRGDGADARYRAGAEVIIGGPLANILKLLCLTAGWLDPPASTLAKKMRTPAVGQPRPLLGGRVVALIAAIVALMAGATIVFRWALPLSWIDSVYFTVTTITTTGYGDIALKDAPMAVKIFDIVLMVTGACLLGILFSNLAAKFTADRLDDIMGRRADRMSGHVVVAGLGNLGYRVTRELLNVGMKVVAVDASESARFIDSARRATAVLIGDCRLAETLERAGIRRARAVIACTNDDLVNVQACLHAKRLNDQALTVARVYNDSLADSLSDAFTIDAALSTSKEAAPAFVGAALDERALRSVKVGGESYHACRHRLTSTMTAADAAQMRSVGVRLLAFRRGSGPIQPPSEMPQAAPLGPGDEIVICGPRDEVEAVIAARR